MTDGYERLEALVEKLRSAAMIDTPKVTQTTAQLTAMIHLTVPRAEIQKVMGPGLDEVKAAVAAQGIAVTGPWLTHHLKMDPKVFDFEICVPVASPVSATGRVKPGKLPASKVARTVYHGGYEGLGEAWGELGKWIKAQGPQARARPLGSLRHGSGVQPRPFHLAHGAEQAPAGVGSCKRARPAGRSDTDAFSGACPSPVSR